MSDQDPYEGSNYSQQTMAEFAKAALERARTLKNRISVLYKPSESTNTVHMGVFDGLIEVAEYDAGVERWYVQWKAVGQEQRCEMHIEAKFDVAHQNTANFLIQHRQQILQRFRAERLSESMQLPKWQQNAIDSYKPDPQAIIQGICDRGNADREARGALLDRVAAAPTSPYQFNVAPVFMPSEKQHLAVLKGMEAAMRTGTGFLKTSFDGKEVRIDAINAGGLFLPEVVLSENERVEAVATMNRLISDWKFPNATKTTIIDDTQDGKQPVPRAAEVISPELMSKKLQEW